MWLHGPDLPSLLPFQLPPEHLDFCFGERLEAVPLRGVPVMRLGQVLLPHTTRGRHHLSSLTPLT